MGSESYPMATNNIPEASQKIQLDTLRLQKLSLINIGPFDQAELEFLADEGASPVTIITGENGSGKSIILDAIRGMFGPFYAELERPIWRPKVPFKVSLDVEFEGEVHQIQSDSVISDNSFTNPILGNKLAFLPHSVAGGETTVSWVVDFWRSNLATDSYSIQSLPSQNHRDYLRSALQGIHYNVDVTKLLCYFDYLRDSRVSRERLAGEVLFETCRKIVQMSLLDGELLDVERTTFTPMVRQGAQTVALSSLSSGNAYMIQRMIGMLGKMHAVNVLNENPPETMCQASGVLLMNEAENHLHPRWQKRFLSDILSVFPNLQIIATTHSPFIVGSVPGAKVFVCRYDSSTRSTNVADVSADYAGLPVEDILVSEAFDGTEVFGTKLTHLLEERKRAIEENDRESQQRIEDQLYTRNPRYFSYLKLDKHIAKLRAGGALWFLFDVFQNPRFLLKRRPSGRKNMRRSEVENQEFGLNPNNMRISKSSKPFNP
jgi:hypothetical protein